MSVIFEWEAYKYRSDITIHKCYDSEEVEVTITLEINYKTVAFDIVRK